MHDSEIDLDASLVTRLLAEQFPQWADLPVGPVRSAGTDNALYRIGKNLVARLPRILGATSQVAKEQQWLPKLAPLLPLAIPVPVAKGEPGDAYPWCWSIYRWIEGENLAVEQMADPRRSATDLGNFIKALQRIDSSAGPRPGIHGSFRGEPLAMRDERTREAIQSLRGILDTGSVTARWKQALAAPVWDAPGVWLHGDLQSGNLLAVEGRLSAVIDFGCLGVGDPACDIMTAWTYLTAKTRTVFRAALQVDEATWARGRGWALSFGVIALPYYQDTNPILAAIARRAINEVLADPE
jgi:aminoglycoside phosphotransferase (APT) family kinase protein